MLINIPELKTINNNNGKGVKIVKTCNSYKNYYFIGNYGHEEWFLSESIRFITNGIYLADDNDTNILASKNFVDNICGGGVNHFGVADNITQILENEVLKEEVIESDRKFILFVKPIYKKDQPPKSGWQRIKWGEYIGVHKHLCEYLYNEPVIKRMVSFLFYEIIEKEN